MFVKQSVAADATANPKVNFFVRVYAKGNWDTSKCIYNCIDLTSVSTTRCPNFVLANNQIEVANKERFVEIRSVKVVPNNANAANAFRQDLLLTFRLDTTIRATDGLHDTSLTIAIPASYALAYTRLDRRDLFANFKAVPTFTANTITFVLKEDLLKNVDYSITVVQGVFAPASHSGVADAFAGFSMYKSTVIDDKQVGNAESTGTMYPTLSTTVTLGTDATLAIFPNLRGEKASYSFEFSPAADVESANEIWVQFDADYYDFFVADLLAYKSGEDDPDGE